MTAGLRLAIVAAVLAGAAQAAPARLNEAEARAFVARQEKAWNAGDVVGFFALATPDAAFTDQARAKDGRIVVYGTSTLAQARAQATRFFAKSRTRETVAIVSVRIAPDGRSARIVGHEDAVIANPQRSRHICAETLQTIVLTAAGVRSKGQIDTVTPCR
ncbi:hypothetical protein [Phenylobacterium sp.]|uniref:hypothetical protein n=1 Tax=Phenylobacterium sp. TaxID=1871053 RepID=UPI002DF3BCCA|nr:hypothetical protein [Phenylobacterium sp.]